MDLLMTCWWFQDTWTEFSSAGEPALNDLEMTSPTLPAFEVSTFPPDIGGANSSNRSPIKVGTRDWVGNWMSRQAIAEMEEPK
jgi:hypothetical protein